MKKYILTLLLSGLTIYVWAQDPTEPVATTHRYATVKTEAVVQSGIQNETQLSALSSDQKRSMVSYLDGLGRPISQIAIKANPNQHDLIQLFAFDKTGKVDTTYLPYAANLGGVMGNRWLMITGMKNFYNTTSNTVADDVAPFAVNVYENTPGGYLKEHGAPGAGWQPEAGHTSTLKTLVNASNEIRIWREDLTSPGFYAVSSLTIQYLNDENGNTIKAYTDKTGRLIEKHVQVATSEWLVTRNIYDRTGRLKYVLQPEGVVQVGTATTISASIVEHQSFQYTHDSEGRLVEMKAPGMAVLYYCYDPLGRLTLTQDGNLRAANKWVYVKYDRKGRQVIQGLYLQTTHTTRTAVQQNLLDVLNYHTGETFYEKKQSATTHGYTNQSFPTSNTEVLAVNYYDDYDVSADGTPDYSYVNQGISGEGVQFKTVGKLTATKSLMPGTSQWLYAYIFYDQYGRVIQQRTNNHVSGLVNNLVTAVYDFEGKVLQTKTYHATPMAQVTVVNRYTYDHAGRITKVYQKNNTDAEVLVSSYSYDELGKLVDKKLHSTDGGLTFLQSIDYRHNIRGWLTSINNAQLMSDGLLNDDNNDLFGMELLYNATTAGLNSGTGEQYYNGSISAMKWQGIGGSGSEGQRSYKFNYDKANRLLQATYGVKTATTWTGEAGAQNESMTFDKNGNIKTLTRTQRKYGWTEVLPGYTAETIDNLAYTFANNGNQLLKVEDTTPGTVGTKGFVNGAQQATEYTYDVNGSLTADKNKGIDSVKYSLLGKVSRVKFSDGRLITYQYNAGGAKLTQRLYQGSTLVKTTQYVNGFVYENDTLRFFGLPEGRVVNKSGVFEHQYAITDHQGNTRVVFSSVVPETDESKANFESSTNNQFINANSNPSGMSEMNHTASGSYSQLLHGGYSSQVGAAKTIHVYPGDTVKAEVYAKYRNTTATPGNLLGFASALTAVFGVNSLSMGEALNAYHSLNDFGAMAAAGDRDDDDLSPKGFITIMLFDKHHNILDAAWDQIDEAYEQTGVLDNDPFDLLMQQMVVKEEGYAYIFVSNENPTKVDIHFDDLKITHAKTNVIQYNEYYPFGLQTTSSWTREGVTGNNFLYNGPTETNTTTGWGETMFRSYDAAIGRFMQVDPLAEITFSMSPYQYANNNPIVFIDPLGLTAVYWEGGNLVIDMNGDDYGGSWSRDRGYQPYGSSLEAFYAGAAYMDAYGMWGGRGFASDFGGAARLYSELTGEATPLREVQINVRKSPYGGLTFGGEPYYASKTWLHDRLNEATFDYWTWAKTQHHDALDAIGLLPIIGEVADGANGLLYLYEGDYVNASISGASMVPIVGWASTGTKVVLKTLPWSSKSLAKTAKLLEKGASSVTVESRAQAEELFMGLYQGGNGKALINTTGLSAVETKNLYGTKAGTYHWDLNDTQHGGIPHLQIHDFDGNVTRIFFNH